MHTHIKGGCYSHMPTSTQGVPLCKMLAGRATVPSLMPFLEAKKRSSKKTKEDTKKKKYFSNTQIRTYKNKKVGRKRRGGVLCVGTRPFGDKFFLIYEELLESTTHDGESSASFPSEFAFGRGFFFPAPSGVFVGLLVGLLGSSTSYSCAIARDS